ncbi:MAG TPA: YcnI family protein [Actinomycetota bacterium]|nr:YcnI family protein [Actinomycetota bacterium]
MKKGIFGALAVSALVAGLAPAAYGHVTVQPNEAVVGTFSRFVVRVPTERDVPTIKVKVELPPMAFVSFEPKEGWKRTVEMVELDEPIEVFGEPVTETVGSVTWSGGEIGPGEFDEFGFSARMPDAEETLEFVAEQTYKGGEVVSWSGAPDSDEPAALLTTYDLNLQEGQGQLAALAELRQQMAGGEHTAAPPVDDEEDDDYGENLGLLVGGGAVLISLIALALALRSRRS